MLDVRFSQRSGWTYWAFESLRFNAESAICTLVMAARCVNGGMPLSHSDLLLAAICLLASKLIEDQPVSLFDAARVLNMRRLHLEAAERYAPYSPPSQSPHDVRIGEMNQRLTACSDAPPCRRAGMSSTGSSSIAQCSSLASSMISSWTYSGHAANEIPSSATPMRARRNANGTCHASRLG